MKEHLFKSEDLQQIKDRGAVPENILSQIETFRKGISFARLLKPCTIGDGLIVIPETELERLIGVFDKAALSGRIMKFVPASGAASRMFKLLHLINNRYDCIDEKNIGIEAEKGCDDHQIFLQFIKNVKKFAFYNDLKNVISEDGLDLDGLISEGDYTDILEYMLTEKGLNYTWLPKGLIKFHNYPDVEKYNSRTSIEEHLVEASVYARDRNGTSRIHFTISPEHESTIKAYIEKILPFYESSEVKFKISYSFQYPSTDTIAVNPDNTPFRDEYGSILFRPGGHGALLQNLNDLEGDIVFIKNIDNVVPDCLKNETYVYKRTLCGYLVELQQQIFAYLEVLTSGNPDNRKVREIIDFAREKISVVLPEGLEKASTDETVKFLISKLNRPLRVCGMVKNFSEPGGGPFWVENNDKVVSPQIIESSQVDFESTGQRSIWERSTHFNPVDLVCGVRDFQGKPFNLMAFSDPDAGFISSKSRNGNKLKALELPGLWNGSMANWNTVFVEVPYITFNPVKTVFDLLRKEHQAVFSDQ